MDVARAQHIVSEPQEKKRLSTAPETNPNPALTFDEAVIEESPSSPLANATDGVVGGVEVIKAKNRRTKTRDDGSKYVEVEYTDGSIEIQEKSPPTRTEESENEKS